MRVRVIALIVPVLLLVLAGLPASAQDVISAQSGLVNFTQGPVLLNDRAIRPAKGQFPQMKEQDTLRTSRGRAEILLSPGVFLRVGDDSEVRMISNQVTDSRLELLSGAAVVEAAALLKGNAVSIASGGATVSILKRGLYRLTAEPAQLKVFDGKALVESGGQRVEVGKGKMVSLGGPLATAKFNRKQSDSLDLWSERRAEYLAMANLATARSFRSSGRLGLAGWGWNPYYGLYTFIPLGGGFYSPYGFYYWSPRAVNAYSTPRGPASPSVNEGLGSVGTRPMGGGPTAGSAPPGGSIGGRSLGPASSAPVSAPSSAPSRGVPGR